MYFKSFLILQKVILAAMETDRLCLSPAVQDILHEQRYTKDCCISLKSAGILQVTQTQLQIKQICRKFKFVAHTAKNIKWKKGLRWNSPKKPTQKNKKMLNIILTKHEKRIQFLVDSRN